MTIRCHCVSSRFWPSLSVNRSVVARLTVATGVPPAVNRISASRPRLPTRMALLTLPIRRILPDLARIESLEILGGLQSGVAGRVVLPHQLVAVDRLVPLFELFVRD